MVSTYTFGNKDETGATYHSGELARERSAAASDAIVGDSSALKSAMQEVKSGGADRCHRSHSR